MDNFFPPVVTTKSSVVPIFARIRLSDMFSVTDADVDSVITKYRFRDNSALAGSFLIGEKLQESRKFIEISAGQLGSVAYRGASTFARETFSIQAFDGVYWSNIATNLITSGNVTPVITTTDGRVTEGEMVRIDSFVNVTDGDGDPILRYMFVDRKPFAGGGQFFLNGVARQQARWFTIQAGDFSRLMYRGADQGRDVENIGVMAWDGYSWSEIAEFEMATTTRPIVTETAESVLVNERRAATDFFDTADQDGDPIFSYVVADYRINADGGYWEFKGQRMQSAKFFTVFATDLDKLFYVGGSTGPQSELVGVQVYDGHQFSELTNFEIKTVTPPVVTGEDVEVQAGHYLNMATGGTKNTIDGEVTGSMPILEFEDADGDEIDEFLFNDRSFNGNGGHFVFKDVRVPSANYFRVKADELDQLFYRGGEFGPQSEQISVLAKANGVWSVPGEFRIGTLKNQFAPELNLFEVNAKTGVVMSLEGLFTWSDADGDAIHFFSFLDTGDDPSSGYFSVNGVRQPAKTWVSLAWDQLSKVKYHLSSLANTEDIRMTLYDGRNVSKVKTATINSIAAPVIDATINDITVGTIERVPASSLITQIDTGPSFRQYQVYDENDFFRSGRLELDGNDLQQGVVHTLTADEFSRMVFKGAETDFGRQLDPMLVRADNGITGWTEWERINVNTDPIGGDSLISGTQITKKNAGPKTIITYSFIDGGNQSGGTRMSPNYPPLPIYYPPGATCMNPIGLEALNTRGLSQPQRESIREVMANYETYANVDFVEEAYTLAGEAEIIFGAWGNFDCGLAGASAYAFLPFNGDGRENIASDIWFNTNPAVGDFDPLTPTDVSLGSAFRQTAAHEIGHALGFKHPFSGDPFLSIFTNFDYNTVMAYQHDSVHNVFDPYADLPSSLMLYDIGELQSLYGANTDYNSNNNHYGNFFSGSYPHFINNNEQHQTTIWDGGGKDTFNFTNHVADETIDLREGVWNSINGVPQSIRIAYGTIIENARGGAGDDNIRGNEIANLLFGNGGADVLRGGGDNDVLRGGEDNDTYVWSLGDGRDHVREEGKGGLDVVEFYDPSGSIDSLEDDFIVRRFGSELRIDLTLDQGQGQGTVSIVDFDNPDSAVELMRIHGLLGTQIGNDIDLVSLFDIASSTPTRYFVTDVEGLNGGFIAAPVT